jgi:hypothetical protein
MEIVDVFPYTIHFEVDESKRLIIIYAVIHMSRNPDIWDERTLDDDGLY